MSIVLTGTRWQDTKIFGLLDDLRHGNIWLWRTVVAMLIGTALMLVLQFFDARLFNGVSVWDKPAKFFLSLAVQFATVSWALCYMSQIERSQRSINWAVWLMLIAGWGEIFYIIFRASRAEASHFNSESLSAVVGYAMMGIGALTLTFSAAFIGWKLWAKRGAGLWREAAGLGLILGSALGTASALYMSAHQSHWMGGVQTDAGGLPIFNWSVSGGDLRVAHFVGLHASQIVPLAALSGDRRVVYFAGVAMITLTAAIYVMGMTGNPLFKA